MSGRKMGPVRQLSLQSDIRRPVLKKQLSVEHLESIEEHKRPNRVESAKTNKLSDRPRPIRVAWAENRQTSKDEPTTPKSRFGEVEIKKCKEHKRPVTAKIRTHTSVETESILYTRQELAERLRKAWKDREDNKQNLDIFLARNVEEKQVDDDFEEEVCYDQKIEVKQVQKPQKIVKQKSVTEFVYIPSTTANRPQDVRTNISVTIPIVVNNKINDNSQPDSLETKTVEQRPAETEERKEPKLVKQASLITNKENENIKSLPQRPSTASAKRESFQKRTNTAFTGSVTSFPRPPLTRTLSVPVKSDGTKLKFIATKRRLKSARRKGKEEEPHSGDDNVEDGEKTTKKGSRCKSAPGGEVVTMVSLISPTGSDTEEQEEKEVKSRSVSPVKIIEPVKAPTLRKTGKSVSFQQSSIHTVRSFSASFPSRRSVMTAMSSGSTSGVIASEREKRAPLESTPGLGESRGPKRRLVRAVSVSGEDSRGGNSRTTSFDDDSSHDARPNTPLEIPEETKQTLGVTRAEILPSKKDTAEKKSEDSKDDGTSKDNEDKAEDNGDPSIPKFESNKERECWIMFKKMNDKGLPVSYDTILRGMLTPTEYRSVRKEIKSTS